MVKKVFILAASLLAPLVVLSSERAWQLPALDGGEIDLTAHDGPILLVNTASLCAFTPQYDALQALHERFAPRGLMVVAVPSDDFAQELDDASEVAEFCEVNFDLTLPIADILSVSGPDPHPVFADLKSEFGVAPRWNFHKFLIAHEQLLGHWSSTVRPDSPQVTDAIEAALR